MYAEVDTCPLAGFHNFVFKLLLHLCYDFLDTCRMDTSVEYELVKGKACNLSSYWVECRKKNCFRGIIYDDFYACCSLECADVTSFTTDDAALYLVTLDMEYSYCIFNGCFGCCTLDSVDYYA